MIEFKIITSPDRSQQATYQHLGKELTFGQTEGDMLIDDPGFSPLQIRIVVLADKNATLESMTLNVEVRLNGKPISGVVPLKEKDNVTVARTTINFSRLGLGPLPIPEPYEYPSATERFTPGSKEQTMLDVLDFLAEHPGALTGNDASESGASKPPPAPGSAPPRPPLPPGRASPPPLPKKS